MDFLLMPTFSAVPATFGSPSGCSEPPQSHQPWFVSARGCFLVPSPHLGDEQDTLQEHVVLVVLVHGLLIHKVPGLQVWVVWGEQRALGSEPGPQATWAPRPSTLKGQFCLQCPQHLTLQKQ